ncbi:uncharacterized protein DUF397 [Tamaricihabitans halophyticus]|uniref:Uncharacterized protein DUF397 n=1 Tax=Tamaricihabitans halophyticus TaxID=1262583 RepID=A0A4R2RCA4_9PSEU|nr:DUF397 domain-containing protein [Tamaricihabitans halophyticus]TCP57055.1 uncharacterized protein DUF397 [Tamaricihabitans halophyticus]
MAVHKELGNLHWRKSSFSAGAENCVEVATAPSGGHYLRDSKNPSAGTHHFTNSAWITFIHAITTADTP